MMDSSCACVCVCGGVFEWACCTFRNISCCTHARRAFLFLILEIPLEFSCLSKTGTLLSTFTLVCFMNEVCVISTASLFAAVTVCSTLHAHKGVITISYPTHTKTLTLHHLHNEFTRNVLLIPFHVTLHQRPNWKYCKEEETGGKYGSSTCGSLSWTSHQATGPHIPL